ncbi:MAG: Hpt domain-containing protein, partial [Lachnospiraceae bacterium]
MDVSQYLEIFIDETKEHLQSLNEQILILEREPENVDTINEIFRAAHSLKGMAGTMGYKRMQRLTHDMENVFSEIRNGKMKASAKLVDVLFKGLDALEQYLDVIVNSGDEGTEDNEDIIKALNDILNEGVGGGAAPAAPAASAPAAAAVASAPAAVAVSDTGVKAVKLADHEKSAIAKALSEKMNAFTMTVYIQESCILKAARAFLVFKALEELGTVIHSEPQVQDIEDEHFDFDFTVVLLTEADAETAKKKVENVSEIKCACVEAISPEAVAEVASADNSSAAAQTSAQQKESAAPAAAAQQKTTSKPVVNRSVRVDIDKLDDLMNLVSELIIAKNGLVSINTADMEGLRESGFNEQIEYLERITTNLHQSVMKTRMVPIENVVSRFPRMIRDISKKLDKKMELYMSGEETELDRTVIDEIGDPLMHMLRNAADHGLESNEERIKAGKPEVGSIFLNAYRDGNNVVIEVRDDGKGIDVEKVKKKAVEKGTLTPEQAAALSEKETIDLLFRPSFSTAEKISDLSGRGVGLDVVKSKIEALGGDVEAKTVLGAGTTFIVRLPLTLAIIQALMVELANEKYAIPLGSIQTIEDVLPSDIKYVQTKEVIHLRGNVIPLIRLRKVLDVEPDDFNPESLTVVI